MNGSPISNILLLYFSRFVFILFRSNAKDEEIMKYNVHAKLASFTRSPKSALSFIFSFVLNFHIAHNYLRYALFINH